MAMRGLFIGGLVLAMVSSAATADIAVWMEPADATVAVGDTTTVDIVAMFDAPIVGWGIDLSISEPALVGWTATDLGVDWDVPGSTIDGDGLAGLRFPTGVAGEVLLATLTFEGLDLGTTDLVLSSGPEEDEGFVLELGGFDTNVAFLPATLTVVPEPTALVFISILAMSTLRRRR